MLVPNPASLAPSILVLKVLVMPHCRTDHPAQIPGHGLDHNVPGHQLKLGQSVQMGKSRIKEMSLFYKGTETQVK